MMKKKPTITRIKIISSKDSHKQLKQNHSKISSMTASAIGVFSKQFVSLCVASTSVYTHKYIGIVVDSCAHIDTNGGLLVNFI